MQDVSLILFSVNSNQLRGKDRVIKAGNDEMMKR